MELIRQGRMLYWGASEWNAAQICQVHEFCRRGGWRAPVVNQPYDNLLGPMGRPAFPRT